MGDRSGGGGVRGFGVGEGVEGDMVDGKISGGIEKVGRGFVIDSEGWEVSVANIGILREDIGIIL